MKVSITFEKNIKENRKQELISEIQSVVNKLNTKQNEPSRQKVKQNSQSNLKNSPVNANCSKNIEKYHKNNLITTNIIPEESKQKSVKESHRDYLYYHHKNMKSQCTVQRNQKEMNQQFPKQNDHQRDQTRQSELYRKNSQFQWTKQILKQLASMQSNITQKFSSVENCVISLNNKLSKMQNRLHLIETEQKQHRQELQEIKSRDKIRQNQNMIFWDEFTKIQSRYNNIQKDTEKQQLSSISNNRNRTDYQAYSQNQTILQNVKWQDDCMKDTLDSYFTK